MTDEHDSDAPGVDGPNELPAAGEAGGEAERFAEVEPVEPVDVPAGDAAAALAAEAGDPTASAPPG